jgi:hypothetical protein
MSYPKDGVIGFSITTGMPLTGVYHYTANPNGPVISAKQGYFDVSRSPKSVSNQWTEFYIGVPKPVTADGGLIIQFDISYATVQPPTEVKLTLTSDVILRYDGSSFNYVYWANDAFHELGKSAIKVDGHSHRVALCFSPNAIVIAEDGIFIAKWDRSVAASLEPIFNWQILNASSSLSAKFSNILIIPPTLEQVVQTPWDIVLTSKWSYPSDIWVVTETDRPIPFTYDTTYMRVATDSLKLPNSWVLPSVVLPPVKGSGIVTYRMRVNVSGGSESKITIVGENILRITDGGKTVLWTEYTPSGQFVTLAKSSIVVGSGKFTEVTVVYGLQTITLFEDGEFRYTRSYPDSMFWQATWSVQHLDAGTAISTDISNVRCLPLAMSYPPLGKYNIYNYKFDNRVVDLSGSNPNGPIIGYPFNVPVTLNQEWDLVRVKNVSDKNSFGVQNLVSTTCFASTPDTVLGSPLFGSTVEQVFSIQPLPNIGVWSIGVPAPAQLDVHLSSELPNTQLILDTTNPDDDEQKWQFVRALNL